MTENSQEYQDWYELHESKCTINHSGSSVVMEVAGALVLWKRSVERLNLRYVNVISDGDSKSIKALQKAEPYGEDVRIEKYECVEHVQKRVGQLFIDLTKKPLETVDVLKKKAVRGRKAKRGRPEIKAQDAVYEQVTRSFTESLDVVSSK